MADKKEKVDFEVVFTPIGEAIFPHLVTPSTTFKADGEYNVKLAVDGEEVKDLLTRLNEVAEAQAKVLRVERPKVVAKEKNPTKRAKLEAEPEEISVPYEEEYDEEEQPTGRIVLRIKRNANKQDKKDKTKKVPVTLIFVDAAKNVINNPVEPWGGSKLRVKCLVSPFCVPASNLAGVTLKPLAVQVIELRTGNRDQGFGAVDGGYRSEESVPDEEEQF